MTEASYLALHRTGELARRAEAATALLDNCRLCGWDCGIDRAREVGPCRTGLAALVATAYVHSGEERPLVAGGGSGAIFFANCDLRCQFCQTARWNILGQGKAATSTQLAELMLGLQAKGAVNINLVTPTHVAAQIVQALALAAAKGLHLPLVWNSGGYDAPEALALVEGLVDIYLPDMKYACSEVGRRLSNAPRYTEVNRAAVREMYRQVGHLAIDGAGRAMRGLIVRHLVMPGYEENSREVLRWIAENLGSSTYLSLMDQYRPAYRAFAREGINRPISPDEYDAVRDYAIALGLTRLDDHLILSRANGGSVAPRNPPV